MGKVFNFFVEDLIREKLKEVNRENLVRKMGYSYVPKGLKSLDLFLSKDLLSFFESGMYDFVYTPEEFFLKLCKALQIDRDVVESDIKKIHEILSEKRAYENSYIYVNTYPTCSSAPFFARACMASRKRLKIDVYVLMFKSDEEVFKIVSDVVKDHYKKTEGKIPIWGKIKNYVYYHKDGKAYVFDTDGNLIDTNEEICESKITFKI